MKLHLARWLAVGMLGVALAPPAHAQISGEGLDAVSLPAPIAPSRFSALEASERVPAGELSSSLRLGLLGSPVALGLPSPSADGGRATAVEGVVLTELTLAYGLPAGFDLGAGLAFHAYQWGSGTSAWTGGGSLEAAAFADPRLALGWSRSFDDFSLRPYAQLFVPLGDPRAFAGEGAARGDLGVAASQRFDALVLALDVAIRLRETRPLGVTRLGPQLRVGLGVAFTLSEHLSLGPELVVEPSLAEQSAPPDGEAGFLFPSQLRATLRYQTPRFSVLGSGGSGLPTSRSSSLTGSTMTRGLTSPSYVFLFELRTRF